MIASCAYRRRMANEQVSKTQRPAFVELVGLKREGLAVVENVQGTIGRKEYTREHLVGRPAFPNDGKGLENLKASSYVYSTNALPFIGNCSSAISLYDIDVKASTTQASSKEQGQHTMQQMSDKLFSLP